MIYCNYPECESVVPIKIVQKEILYISYDVVADMVCKHYGLTRIELSRKTNVRRVTIPRQIAMTLMCSFVRNATTISVGERFNKDHSTVVYSRKTVNDLCDTDKDYRLRFQALHAKLEALKYDLKESAA